MIEIFKEVRRGEFLEKIIVQDFMSTLQKKNKALNIREIR